MVYHYDHDHWDVDMIIHRSKWQRLLLRYSPRIDVRSAGLSHHILPHFKHCLMELRGICKWRWTYSREHLLHCKLYLGWGCFLCGRLLAHFIPFMERTLGFLHFQQSRILLILYFCPVSFGVTRLPFVILWNYTITLCGDISMRWDMVTGLWG